MKSNRQKKERGKIDRLSILVSMFLLAALAVATIIAPVATTQALVNIRIGIVDVLGFYFLLLVFTCLVFVAYMAFSKYGAIKMGHEEPEYTIFSWISMIFSAAIGYSILYWSAIEWIYYIQSPPFGLDPFSPAAAEIAVAYSFFHWGLPAWSLCAVGIITLAYRHYVRKKPGLTLQAACEGWLGDKIAGPVGKMINILFIFSILGGLTISYGTGVPMLANNLSNIFGLQESFRMYAGLIIIITVTFGFTTFVGLKKGLQVVAKGATIASLFLCAIFLTAVCPGFILDNFVQSTGLLVDNFIKMSTNLDPVARGGFPQAWTCFYFAWWITLSPWMWVFVAKISKGRSIRSIVATVTLSGMLGSMLFFGTISSYGLNRYLTGALDAVGILTEKGASQAVSEVVLSLPFGSAVLVLWVATAFARMVTTMDSAAYTLGAAATYELRSTEDPNRYLRLFWAVMLSVCPLSLLYAGQFMPEGIPLGGLQAILVIIAIPITITVYATMYSALKWTREDYGAKTRGEIEAEFACATGKLCKENL
jgi:betaine/carnitine transporter, BCCT family